MNPLGQSINLGKSSVIFFRGVSTHKKQQLADQLGVKVAEVRKYLGGVVRRKRERYTRQDAQHNVQVSIWKV